MESFSRVEEANIDLEKKIQGRMGNFMVITFVVGFDKWLEAFIHSAVRILKFVQEA